MIKSIIYYLFFLLSTASIIHIPILNVARIYLAIWFVMAILFLLTHRKFSFHFLNIKWLIFPLFLLLHLVSLFYTENLPKGFFDIEVKLSFLVIPFIFFILFQHFHDKIPIEKMKRLYLTSLFIILSFLIIRAIVNYISDRNISHFYYNDLSWKYHPSYLAMYISLGVVFFIEKFYSTKTKASYLFLIAITLLLAFLFLLSSKAGILVIIVLMLTASFFQIIWHKRILKPIILLMISIAFAFFGIHDNYRFKSVEQSIKTADTNVQTTESNAVRVLIWETGIDLIKKYWLFGVGCGDIKDVLLKEYEKRNMQGAIEKRLNLHNQFLETWLSLGVLGLFIIVLILMMPFYLAYKQKNLTWLLFILLISINFMAESMLNTQAGVIFILYFYYFFIVEHKLKIHDTVFATKNR